MVQSVVFSMSSITCAQDYPQILWIILIDQCSVKFLNNHIIHIVMMINQVVKGGVNVDH